MSDHIIKIIWAVKIFFVQFFCLFLPPPLNIFCFCLVHTISALYCARLCKNVPLLSLIFLNISLDFPILLFSSISLHWSLRQAFLSLLAILWTLHSDGHIFPFLLCLSLLFFSQLYVRLPKTTILPYCICFSWGWSWSLSPVQCHEPPSTVLQALGLSDLIHWIYFSLPLYNCKRFDLGHSLMI